VRSGARFAAPRREGKCKVSAPCGGGGGGGGGAAVWGVAREMRIAEAEQRQRLAAAAGLPDEEALYALYMAALRRGESGQDLLLGHLRAQMDAEAHAAASNIGEASGAYAWSAPDGEAILSGGSLPSAVEASAAAAAAMADPRLRTKTLPSEEGGLSAGAALASIKTQAAAKLAKAGGGGGGDGTASSTTPTQKSNKSPLKPRTGLSQYRTEDGTDE
jgi:hypothetical protein